MTQDKTTNERLMIRKRTRQDGELWRGLLCPINAHESLRESMASYEAVYGQDVVSRNVFPRNLLLSQAAPLTGMGIHGVNGQITGLLDCRCVWCVWCIGPLDMEHSVCCQILVVFP